MWDEARSFYHRAVRLNPKHRAARQALQLLHHSPGFTEPISLFPNSPSTDNFSIYNMSPPNYPPLALPAPNNNNTIASNTSALVSLDNQNSVSCFVPSNPYGPFGDHLNSNEMLLKYIQSVMDYLHRVVHPSLTAYLDKLLLACFGLLSQVFLAVTVFAIFNGYASNFHLWVFALVLLIFLRWSPALVLNGIVCLFTVIMTKYGIEKGAFWTEKFNWKGLFWETSYIECYRIRYITYRKTLLNWLTGDITTIFEIEEKPNNIIKVEIKGLVKGKYIKDVHGALLIISVLLRLHPNVRGLIQ